MAAVVRFRGEQDGGGGEGRGEHTTLSAPSVGSCVHFGLAWVGRAPSSVVVVLI